MATSNNVNAHLIDDFEEAFQNCVLALTKPEGSTGPNKEEIEFEAQKTINRFIDVARQMEAFFLQKRFQVSTLKPDQLIKDENQDLRIEIQRKEALLNKHYSRLEEWKACLSEMQQYPAMINRPMSGSGGAVGGAGNLCPGGIMSPLAEITGSMPGPSGLGCSGAMGGMVGHPQRPGMMTNLGGVGMIGTGGSSQQHLTNQKMLQAQQMQQLRLMGKLNK